ncbi:XRE family transcriptional regulator [Periweissella cryptocerci]|uniref:XRE family transcriptional regulator n=1 Tax=Periweissella cryptocerci TaxID=2506420 RepID=A0A4P6YWB6_9LACO|nr:helix-turn-helix transcriptional regulator [Periweissella cryptocerci]QBO37118.1 XRE family transcriptional regulator [Periweissella cryptocerci]
MKKTTFIKNARVAAHLTSDQMSELLNYSRVQYSRMENGKTPIPDNVLFKLPEITNVSSEEIREKILIPQNGYLPIIYKHNIEDDALIYSNKYVNLYKEQRANGIVNPLDFKEVLNKVTKYHPYHDILINEKITIGYSPLGGTFWIQKGETVFDTFKTSFFPTDCLNYIYSFDLRSTGLVDCDTACKFLFYLYQRNATFYISSEVWRKTFKIRTYDAFVEKLCQLMQDEENRIHALSKKYEEKND